MPSSCTLREYFLPYPERRETLDELTAIQNNDPNKSRFYLDECHFLPTPAWQMVGQTLASNDHVTWLDVENCHLSVESFSALVDGLKGNTSITKLGLGSNPSILSEEGMQVLSSYLNHENCRVSELNLQSMDMDNTKLRRLLPMLQNSTKLTCLNLNNNYLYVQDSPLDELHLVTNLEELYLGWNSLGIRGCEALANLLGNKDTKLRKLGLLANRLNNESCRILADGLKGNTTLKEMSLLSNNGINFRGWKSFLQVVCDESSIENTCLSNHTLYNLGIVNDQRVLRGSLSNVTSRLHAMLKINANHDYTPHKKAQKKVAEMFFTDEYNLEPFLDIDVQITPRLLEWIGRECGIHAFHRFIRNWDVAILFGFPSRVKLLECENERLQSKVASLEVEISAMKEMIEKLMKENDSLKERAKERATNGE